MTEDRPMKCIFWCRYGLLILCFILLPFSHFLFHSTEREQLFTFGDGRHGKLGQDQESYCNIYVPTLIERFKKFHVDQVRYKKIVED